MIVLIFFYFRWLSSMRLMIGVCQLFSGHFLSVHFGGIVRWLGSSFEVFCVDFLRLEKLQMCYQSVGCYN